MLQSITKRDGTIEEFIPSKLNKWAIWSTESLGDRVDWSGVVLEAMSNCKPVERSQNLQNELINACIRKKDWPHNVMAGKLYAAWLHKDIYGDKMIKIQDLHKDLVKRDLMINMGYTDIEYQILESVIDHSRDFNYAHSQIKQIYRKYSITNLVTNTRYETPQYTFMRMAMHLASDVLYSESKLKLVKDFYDEFSLNRINAPTPNYVNLGTKLNGYASCCLYTVGDNNESIDAGDLIASKMTAMSAGIGTHHNLRSIGDPVRGGRFPHGGKRPYFATTAKSVVKGVQAGRAGAATFYFDIFEKEAKDLIMLQNPRTPEAKRNRDVHFAVMTNSLFAKKARDNKDIFSFNSFTAPDLHKALFSGDPVKFEELYNKYEADDSFKKEYTNARELCYAMLYQWEEVSTLYHFNVEEANRHTAFQEPIYSSNLCLEVTEPTSPYDKLTDLYSSGDLGSVTIQTNSITEKTISGILKLKYNDMVVISGKGFSYAGALEIGDQFTLYRKEHAELTSVSTVVKVIEKVIPPEVALCSLGSLVLDNIQSDEQYQKSAELCLLMIDKCIHMSHYVLPHIGYTAKSRLNAGVGHVGLATVLARKGLKYSSQEGRDEIHRIAERHAYFVIKASLKLGKELGNAPWMHKTKWPNGWLPIDTYKKSVDELTTVPLAYDWETLRKEIIANGGIRNSCLINLMPTESSSKASGVPNGPYPVRALSIKKTDENNTVDWVATDSDLLVDKYEIGYDIPSERMIECYAILQKFTDQSISADTYRDRSTDVMLSDRQILTDYLLMMRYGVKSKYYSNTLTNTRDNTGAKVEVTIEENCGDSCKL
jgi:ribonucleoside-diphosphate reductase alpha chain